MNAAIDEVRALLGLFAKSPWRDLHVRTDGWEIFFAKPGGAASPMATASGETIDAPHLGLFHAAVAAGAAVTEGTVIGQLEVLGEREDVVADRAGSIAAVLADDGALVEYGAPLVRLAA